jgi:hypothetical protein
MNTIAVQQADLREPSGSDAGKWSRWFVFSAGAILLLTGLAKVISAFGTAHILQMSDPILRISFRNLFLLVGGVELLLSLICFSFNKRATLQVSLIAWLATNFAIYRLCLAGIGYQKPCSCLGNLTGVLHIPSEAADSIMKIILVYLLTGSYLALFCRRKQTNKQKQQTKTT